MFFFFKQKTAYEMRISDWSSDVCSSDLPPAFLLELDCPDGKLLGFFRAKAGAAGGYGGGDLFQAFLAHGLGENGIGFLKGRSAEHTSELQSLMRISYAVFCLKKKNNHILTSLITTTLTIRIKQLHLTRTDNKY